MEEDTPKFSLHMKGSIHQAYYGGTTSCPVSPLGICIFSLGFYPCGSFYTGLTLQCLLKANCIYICKIDNVDLLCSSGNYIQYFVITYMGKISEKDYIDKNPCHAQ